MQTVWQGGDAFAPPQPEANLEGSGRSFHELGKPYEFIGDLITVDQNHMNS